jgi:hypothetical protein
VTKAKPLVIVVDDDPSILRAFRRLISGAGFDLRTFDRPSALLKSDLPKAGVDFRPVWGFQQGQLASAIGTRSCTRSE